MSKYLEITGTSDWKELMEAMVEFAENRQLPRTIAVARTDTDIAKIKYEAGKYDGIWDAIKQLRQFERTEE